MLLLRLRGVPSDQLQLRFSMPDSRTPPVPWGLGAVELLGLVGVVWLVLRLPPLWRAESLAVALAASYAYFLGGVWLQRFGIAVLPEKAGRADHAAVGDRRSTGRV